MLVWLGLALTGCMAAKDRVATGTDPSTKTTAGSNVPLPPSDGVYQKFRHWGHHIAVEEWDAIVPPASIGKPHNAEANQPFLAFGKQQGKAVAGEFFDGLYNRSQARTPENIEKWRSEPNITNPGPDFANFPNSAFTLPQGRAYIEVSPFAYYASSVASPAQYSAEYLLRYGLTDNIELRMFSNGPSWSGGSDPGWGFSPLAFDTKIQLWTEKQEYFIPALGFEAFYLTEWLGTEAFNTGTQPGFSFNFDQSLPWDIDFEYNLGVSRFQDTFGHNVWEFGFQWALQRNFFSEDFALFIHGFYNSTSLPRLPDFDLPYNANEEPIQNAVGAGFLWTANPRLSFYGQISGGTTKYTPSIISMTGFAVAF